MNEIRINNFKETLYYDELPNGLKVYVVPTKNKKSFSAMLVTKYGGRDIKFKVDEQTYNTPTGIAHFLEHKMFERENDPFKFYGKFGADVNASTSDDYTCYFFTGSKCFKKNLKYLLNWIQKIDINEEQVEKEKGIILEEANMYKDNPSRVMYNKIKENAYQNDPKKNKVIGSDQDIKSITKEELELCYKTFYVPNNMFLLVAGNINPKEVFDIAKMETLNFKPIQNIGIPIYNKEPDNVKKEYEEIHMNVSTPRINVSYKMNKNIFKDLNITPFELDLYIHFLINISLGSTSEIKQKWLEKELFIDSFYRVTEIESHYIIEFHATSYKDELLIKSLEKYINDLAIDETSFEREKKIWIANEIRMIENPMNVIYNILDDILDYKEFIPNKIEYIRNLDFETLKKVKECMDYNNKMIIKILPLQSKKEN